MKETREHILKVALVLFLQKSFKAVTMKEIVKKTGLSKGAFYHYFSSKEEVFEEVINVYFKQMLHLDYKSLPSNSLQSFYNVILNIMTDRDKLLHKWYQEISEGDSSRNLYYILFDALQLLPDVKKQQKSRIQEELNTWERVIQNAIDTGEITTNFSPKDLAKQFVYASDGIAIHLVMISSPDELLNEVRNVWNSLYESIRT